MARFAPLHILPPAQRRIDPALLGSILAAPEVARQNAKASIFGNLAQIPSQIVQAEELRRGLLQQQAQAQQQAQLNPLALQLLKAKIASENAKATKLSQPPNPLQQQLQGLSIQQKQQALEKGMQPKPNPTPKDKSALGLKIFEPALDASRRLLVMQDAVNNPSPQSDVSLLFNHIGMTLSAQRGARITEAEVDRAIKSRSLPQNLSALWTSVTNGNFLTPEQRKGMLNLGERNRDLIWESSRNKANFLGIIGEPKDISGLSKPTAIPQKPNLESLGFK